MECIREQVENGREYLLELVSGDPDEPFRRAGLVLAAQLEEGIALLLEADSAMEPPTAAALARVFTAVVHVATTASIFAERSTVSVLGDVNIQVRAVLSARMPVTYRPIGQQEKGILNEYPL
ncbi:MULTISPECIES: hypothetical protein [unclassified Frondihabitans]|uniref:hypothetical protein n=1 Tax=unclassified Frondihabitans TaxID=2626248 RepID=UPI0018F2A966|nr:MULTISPECIES: hypothetical protein [unclassified Frondihabitans]